jgi:hypothetical protein
MEQRVPKLLEAMTTYFATQQAAILEEIKTDWLTYDLPKIKTLAEWEGEMAKRIQSTNDARIVEKELYASYLLLTQSSVEIPIGNLLVLSLYLRYYHDKSQRIEENILGLLIGVFIGGLFSVVGIISAFIGEGADTMKEELKKRLLSTSKEDFVNFREHALVLLHMQFPQIAKKYENH